MVSKGNVLRARARRRRNVVGAQRSEPRVERRIAPEHIARRAGREHGAIGEYDDAIRERREQLEILLDDEHGHSPVAQRAQRMRELRGGFGIELRRRLVEHEERRIERERGGERHALQLAARELARQCGAQAADAFARASASSTRARIAGDASA